MRATERTSVTAAIGFLTTLPVAGRAERSTDAPRGADVLSGAILFPLVGAGIGAVVGGGAVALALVLPAFLAATLAVAVELALTGALHLDGLADSADGLGGRDSEHALAIMRDHALGAYGAAALTVVILAKVAAIAALATGDVAAGLPPIVAGYAISRAAPLPLAALLPYARHGRGTGQVLAGRIGPLAATAGVVLAASLALAVAGPQAAALVAAAAAATAVVAAAAHRRLGGVTGDVMGAAIELSLSFALVVAVALWA